MNAKVVMICGLVLTAITGISQEDTTKYWTNGAVFGLNLTQIHLENWAAGGESSLSGTALFNGTANYAKDKMTWDNSLDLAYGLISERYETTQKTDDRIELNSKFGYQAVNKWYYSALANFRTQFAPGYEVPTDPNSLLISDFFSPAYVTAALGMDYKPAKWFTLFISPMSFKGTIVSNQDLADAGAFGVDPATYEFPDIDSVKIADGSNFRGEYGGLLNMVITGPIMENVTGTTKLNLFSNYAENPQNIDVNWEVLISMKVNKWLSASITTNLIYDHDILIPLTDDDGNTVGEGRRTQFKEVLGVGLSYKL